MDDVIAQQPERRINTADAITSLAHKIDKLIDAVAELKAVQEKQGKTLYGNGTAGICENVRHTTEKLDEAIKDMDSARAKIWGLIIAAAGFIVIEVIKII